MPPSRKKVIVRTTDDSLLPGYLPISGFVQHGSAQTILELLDLEARILPIALETVRWVAFVADFNLADRVDPEQLTRRAFLSRPRSEGLWIRLTFRAGDTFEGLAPLDISLVDGLLADRGITIIPPDLHSNTQRLFVPRTSFTALDVLAVITTPSKSKPPLKTTPVRTPVGQESLFPDSSRRPE
jgi:hypothetical protein